jgi:hypothetical protein
MNEDFPSSRRSCSDTLFNLLTTLVLLATVFAGGLFAAIYFNPYLSINPFPPPDVPEPPPANPTDTEVPELPPTWTAAVQPTASPTPSATIPVPTNTQPVASPTPFPFSLQPGTPDYTQNFANSSGCEWMGVAGQVLGLEEQANLDLWVQLGGQLRGSPLDLLSLPGSAPGYGPGGYEFQLGDEPVASENLIWIQLVSPSGNPMSERTYLTTSDECERNLVLVNWVTAE